MSQEIFVIGYPKSGNTWLARLLGDTLDCVVESGKGAPSLADWSEGRNTKYIIRQRHARYFPGGTVVFIQRDPRDVIVSASFYWQIGLNNYINQCLDPNNKKPPNILHGQREFYQIWDVLSNDICSRVKYEELLDDTVGSLKKILSECNLPIPYGDRLERVAKRNSFSKFKKGISGSGNRYPYGETIQLRNMRNGKSGDWVNHLRQRHGRIINDYLWDFMEIYGYEENENWWKVLEE